MNSAPELESDELLALAKHDIAKERYEEALLKLKKVLANSQLTKVPADVFAELGRLNLKLGLRTKAERAFKECLALSPEAVQERFELGLVCFETGRSGPALELWAEVLRRSPLHPPALFFSSLALAQGGNLSDAMKLGQILLTKVEADNLYHSRAKELIQRIEKDPKYLNLPDAARRKGEPQVQH